MRLDAEYERESVSFWSEAIESMLLRVILISLASTGLTPRHCAGVVSLPRAKRGGGNPWRG